MASLLADGVEFTSTSVQILQYNPPYTLPWLRINAITAVLTNYPIDEIELAKNFDVQGGTGFSGLPPDDEIVFFSAPEAGD